jgi:hypothetical protein
MAKGLERVDVDPGEIQAQFEEFSAEVVGVPRDFVFNIDETDGSDHTDSCECHVVASVDYLNLSVHIPDKRHSEHSMLVA